jgi:hypothetical protein
MRGHAIRTKFVGQLGTCKQPFAGRGDGSPCGQQVAAATSFRLQPAAIVRQVKRDRTQRTDNRDEIRLSERKGKTVGKCTTFLFVYLEKQIITIYLQRWPSHGMYQGLVYYVWRHFRKNVLDIHVQGLH